MNKHNSARFTGGNLVGIMGGPGKDRRFGEQVVSSLAGNQHQFAGGEHFLDIHGSGQDNSHGVGGLIGREDYLVLFKGGDSVTNSG